MTWLPLRTGTNMQTRALLAVVRLHRTHGRVMLPDVMRALGRSKSDTWAILDRLRCAELISWEPNTIGTMRPRVTEVPIDNRRSH